MLSFYFGRDAEFCLGGAEGGQSRLCHDSRRRRATSPAKSRRCARRWSRTRRWSPTSRRSTSPRLRALQPAAQAGRGGLEAGEKPDRRHEWRARPVAAVAAADRAGQERRSRAAGCCSRAIATCRGLPARMRSRMVPSAAALRTLRQSAAGSGEPRALHRLRRSSISAPSRRPKPRPRTTPSRCWSLPPMPRRIRRAACR